MVMKIIELQLTEARSTPVICVDVQPEYSGMNDGDENPVLELLMNAFNIKYKRIDHLVYG